MTPQEKSKELIDKFYQSQIEVLSKIGLTEFEKIEHKIAIKSSLIAVDEIIEIVGSDETAIIVELPFWQEVKNELLKQQNNG